MHDVLLIHVYDIVLFKIADPGLCQIP